MNPLQNFITSELEKREKDYISSPAYLLEHYNIENQNIESYNGRQLLEMLQNADDACETATEKKVVINLNDQFLEISNNGEPFNEAGYRSIIYSNLSQKAILQNKIGQKGLGFRSILSWSKEVVINSGGIKLEFSEEIAKDFLKKLTVKSESVRNFLQNNSDTEFPIATLRVPRLIDVTAAEENFHTTISIKLRAEIIEDVQEQILSVINKETLIFLNHVEVIEIDSPKRKIIYKKTYLNLEKTEVSVSSFDELNGGHFEEKFWNIQSKQGVHKGKNYELSVAWNNELNDNENVIFSYFKTQARFPFPALIHGTFDLTADRNQLTNDTKGHNKFLVTVLADLLIESALEIARKNTPSNFLPLTLLDIDFDKIDSVIAEFDFKQIFLEKIKSSSIFPCVNGNYINHGDKPIFYRYPIAEFLVGNDVKNLMPHTSDEKLISFLNELGYFHYTLSPYIEIISQRLESLPDVAYSKLIYHLLTYNYFIETVQAENFDRSTITPFLKDEDCSTISWGSNVFIQPLNEKQFKLPKFLNIRFLNSELVANLLNEFQEDNIEFLLDKFEPYNIKNYSFNEITETLIEYYNTYGNLTALKVKELHSYLYKLFKREQNQNDIGLLSASINTPVLSINGRIKYSCEVYFGKSYDDPLNEHLYNFDKSKILAGLEVFNLENEDKELVRRYFQWLGVADTPRYQTIELDKSSAEYTSFGDFVLRNYDYKKRVESGEVYKDYNHLNRELRSVDKIEVGYFDDLKKILLKTKPEIVFQWIRRDEKLRKTLEDNSETLGSAVIYLNIAGKNNYRFIRRSNIKSYTKWLLSSIEWLPVASSTKKSPPDICCLSKTITEDFSPFVEKPNIDVVKMSGRLDVSEDVIQNYLVLVGVHREISSFSLTALFKMLQSLPISDKDGRVARKIYREIISNFNENKIDIHHPAYQNFIQTGSMFCQKGKIFDYFPVIHSYYIPTKTYGNNVLKLFPLTMIDSKQGAQKIETLFGVKRLKDIAFTIEKEPQISLLNDEFQIEIERFKALVYVLRMNKDTNHDISNRLKKVRILLAYDIEASFSHNNVSNNFELEKFEYISQKRNTFYISVPLSLTSLGELREANQFCQSIAEIFSTVLETEEYIDFIHDLYSKSEIRRESRLLSYTQSDDNTDLITSKRQLNIIDDSRLSFWRAFSIAKGKIYFDISTEEDLERFLAKISKINPTNVNLIESLKVYYDLDELSNLEIVYKLFNDFKIDYKSFIKHFSGLDLSRFFKDELEDYKILQRSNFAFSLYSKLLTLSVVDKEQYFDGIDNFNLLRYEDEYGFISNIELFFKQIVEREFDIKLIENTTFSFDIKIKSAIDVLTSRGVSLPVLLKERKDIQSLLVFEEFEKINQYIKDFNIQENLNKTNESNTVKFRGSVIEYIDFESLAQTVIADLDFAKLKLNFGKTLAIHTEKENSGKGRKNKSRKLRFDTKNEEQIGFIAELICYHKLLDKYGEENVKWMSENANRAYPDKFITCEAGMGYDIELIEKGRVRFVEVKGTSNVNNGIHMSKDELKKAVEFPERYDLLIIENPLTEKPKLKHIKSPFKFKKDQTLFENDKLKVFNDSFVIKFKWDE